MYTHNKGTIITCCVGLQTKAKTEATGDNQMVPITIEDLESSLNFEIHFTLH